MDLPVNVQTGMVVGRYIVDVIDGPDINQEPDAQPVQGKIVFTSSVPYLPNPTAAPDPVTIMRAPIVGVLDGDGYLCTPYPGTFEPLYRGVRLIATDDPDIAVKDWTWDVTYMFEPISGHKLAIPTHGFSLPSGETTDLTKVAKVPSSPGYSLPQAEAAVLRAEAIAQSLRDDANAGLFNGEAATLEIGAVSSGASAEVVNVGDEQHAILNITLEKGDKGDTGNGVPEAGGAFQLIRMDEVASTTEWVTPSKELVGLTQVDNTSDANKPVSIPQAEALSTKQDTLVEDPGDPGFLQNGIVTVDESYIFPDPLENRLKNQFPAKENLTVNVKDFGAKGDGVTDDLLAFQSALAYLVSKGGGELYIPAGRYILNDEWDCYRPNSPRRDIVIRGESQWTTFLIANFYGAGKSLVKSRDPLGVTRSSPTSVMNLQLGTKDRNGPNPVLLDIFGLGESRIESIRFGSSNNTHLSLASLQNVRMRDIVSFYGGRHFNYKNTAGITFTSTAGSGTVTASADIFTALDPGRQFMLMRADGTRAKYLVSTLVDARTVTISGNTPAVTITNAPAVFEPARITTVAGSNQVSANAQVFSADDIGRVIYIWGAAQGSWGVGMLRGRIIELVSGATVRLDVEATVSVTRTEFAVPVVDIYTPASLGALSSDSNDAKIDLLHIENFAGVGLAVESSVFMHINKLKIHGEHAPTNTWASLAHMWLDDYAGTISGDLDGAATGDHRVALCNMNDMLTFDYLATRQVYNEKTFEVSAMTNAGGIAEVKSFNAYSAVANADPYLLVNDANTDPRLIFTGLVNMLGDSLPPRIYYGKNTYFTKEGKMITKSPDGTDYAVNVANGGEITATPV